MVALLIVRAWPDQRAAQRWRGVMMIATLVVACGVAEGRLLWHSLHNRAMRGSVQELLHAERPTLAGKHVFRAQWNHSDRFVLVAMVKGTPAVASDVNEFVRAGTPGDYLLASTSIADPRLVEVRTSGRHSLYRRRD